MAKHLAVMNPAAGGGRCGREAPAALDRLRDAGVEVEVVRTQAAGEATRLAKDAYADGCRDFIAVGGDGTSYEILNGLYPLADEGDAGRPRLGFLPMGTGNSFLRDFTDQGAEYSIAAIVDGRRRACDVIRVTHDGGVLYYINLLSIGFVADVAGMRDRHLKRFGEGGYVAAVVAEVAKLQAAPFPMSIDGGPMDRDPVTFVSFNNSRFTGGKMMMAPKADTADGRVDVIRVGKLGRIALLRTFPKIFEGTHVDHPAVRQIQAARVDFEISQPIDVMVDGESIRIIPERIEVLPGALEVMV